MIYRCRVFAVFAAADRGGSVSEKTTVPSSAVRGQIRPVSGAPEVHSSRLQVPAV